MKKMIPFFETEKGMKVTDHAILSVIFLSFGYTIKNIVHNDINYYWTDSLLISITLAIILFKGVYKSDITYKAWVQQVINLKHILLCLLLNIIINGWFVYETIYHSKQYFIFSANRSIQIIISYIILVCTSWILVHFFHVLMIGIISIEYYLKSIFK